MQDEFKKAQEQRQMRLAKEEGEKARRLMEELTPYIREVESDFLANLLEVEFDKPESVASHHELVRDMQNLSKLQDKMRAKMIAGLSAAQKLEKNSR